MNIQFSLLPTVSLSLQVVIMPRTARKGSKSNIYHVMLRGINRQNIFEEDEDRIHFLNTVNRCKEASGFRLHAFVLMSNHIHFLIEPNDEPLDVIFKRIGTSYAVWYNRKYQRAGHLFQDRFRSESVETDHYYMTVLRYILQNPVKAGMVSSPGEYRWSSYLAYEKGRGALTDIQFAADHFGSREALLEYLAQENDDAVMDEPEHDWRLRDDAARDMICRITQCSSVSDFQKLDFEVQKEYAVKLYDEGLSMGQIARLTGMSKATVSRAVKKSGNESGEEQGLLLRESDSVPYYDTDMVW